MAVRVYDSPTGGNMTYEETIGTVAVRNGTYSFRFGSGGSAAPEASDTIATTTGSQQIFNGAIQGSPVSGTLSLSDGTYSWTESNGSSNPSAFGVTYNATVQSIQIIYWTQVPLAGRDIVASYQTMETQTIDSSIASGDAYLALSVNGTVEPTRTRLLAVPYALKAKESEDAQILLQGVDSLNETVSALETRANQLEEVQRTWSENLGIDFSDPDAVQEFVSSVLDIQRNQRVLKFVKYDDEIGRFVGVSSIEVEALVGQTAYQDIYIQNGGFRPVKVDDIILPEGFALESSSVGDGSAWSLGEFISPHEPLYLEIAFSPSEGRSYSGEIQVVADVTSGPTTLPISGQGLVDTPVAAFVDQWGNENRHYLNLNGQSREFTVKNIGNGNLTISGIEFSDTRLSATLPSPVSIIPGGTSQISFIFTGNSSSVSGNVTLVSNLTANRSTFGVYGSLTPLASNMIEVQGGTLATSNELNGTAVSSFQIGKYEVTWAEWQDVRAWAVNNGYSDLANVGAGSAGDHPVHSVSWYDVVKWMNARSEKEGFSPVYQKDGEVYRTGQSAPTLQSNADGYRLPTEAEWEWAARGGVSSQVYIYSGSNNVNEVAWYFENSSGALVDFDAGRGTWPVGQKASNELGIHDMSGNVWEWCEDLVDTSYRYQRGGSWNNIAAHTSVSYREFIGTDIPDFRRGFRLARNSEQ
jgi:formylglycine-generating enzyme required for sulfatase activity